MTPTLQKHEIGLGSESPSSANAGLEDAGSRLFREGDCLNFGHLPKDLRLAQGGSKTSPWPLWVFRCLSLVGCLGVWGCAAPQKARRTEFPPEPRVVQRTASASVQLAAPQFYLRWDRPYPEAATNRYEVWFSTNVTTPISDWQLYTNTRYGELKLDVKQFAQCYFIVRTALYSSEPIDWDSPMYSDWARKK